MFELVPEGGASDYAAVRSALAAAGLDAGKSERSSWWRAGLADALTSAPADRRRSSRYEAARSPRSTRGATRA